MWILARGSNWWVPTLLDSEEHIMVGPCVGESYLPCKPENKEKDELGRPDPAQGRFPSDSASPQTSALYSSQTSPLLHPQH